MQASTDAGNEGGREHIPSVPLLRMRGITKTFPGVKALQSVDFELMRGEIHCLIGENGAGKSTLMRVLAGAQRPDAGEIEIGGEVFSALSPTLGHRLGIGMIYQEADLVPTLSAGDNIFLGHEPVAGGTLLRKRAMQAELQRLFADLNLKFSPDTIVRDLAPAQRQLVQIAKSLSRRIRVLVLDEPTAALTDNEIGYLFDLLKDLKRRGIGMVYVSHRLNEVMSIADRVTVLRDGRHVQTRPVSEVTKESLIEAMVGRHVDAEMRTAGRSTGDVVLSVRGLSVKGQFDDIGFDLHRGEILGLAGLVGAGRSEVLECLFGVTPPDAGSVTLDGRALRLKSPVEAIGHGFGLVPEERRESGLVLGRPVAENIAFPVLGRLSRASIVSRRKLDALASGLVERLSIKTPSLRQLVRTLSGGNQQKVVIGKWLAADTRILLLDEPTRGIDVNAKFELYQLIRDLVGRGMSVVMASSDLPELLALSDRILVMAEGRLVAELDAASTGQVEIMRHAVARPRAVLDAVA
ncbi:sugar ABC transporter ATP-binding protein [Mesorhizobium sp. ASY16-5R]|uniref:sugar ABC transporter ATP-binding protein n=1 Tax=Mesorhizobium sp. ASY16-5R TaxID=3445772 RepID=UPI003F9F2F14